MMNCVFVAFAVWRHVLGTNDVVDGIDIALGKCIMSNLFLFGIFSRRMILHAI